MALTAPAVAAASGAGLTFTQDNSVFITVGNSADLSQNQTVQLFTQAGQQLGPFALAISSSSHVSTSFTVSARAGLNANGTSRSWLKMAISNNPASCPASFSDPAYSTAVSASSTPTTLCIFADAMNGDSIYAGSLIFTTSVGTTFLPVSYSVTPGNLIQAALQAAACDATQPEVLGQNIMLTCSAPTAINVAITSQNNGISFPSAIAITALPGSSSAPAWLSLSASNLTAHPSGTSPLATLTVNVDTSRTQTPDIALIQLLGDQGSGEFDFLVQAQPSGPPAPTALRFIPIAPCRAVDTRGSTGTFGGPILAGQSSRDFQIPASNCAIPSSAQAYAVNVTVVPTAALRFLTVWPTGQAKPVASTLNSDGRIKANAAIVPAGTNGAISVFATDDTHVILDISGYFVPATNSSALSFYALTPCRVADTRGEPAGPLAAPFLPAGQSRDFPILSSSCNVPSTAQAYSLNFTVVPRGPLSFLRAWPTGQTQPTVSTLNSPTGSFVANAAIVPAGSNGAVSVFTTNDTDVIIDINGYFAAPGQNGLSLYNLTPCRVLDTRGLAGALPITRLDLSVLTGNTCSVAAAPAYVFNATVLPSGSLIFLSLWPTGLPQPNVSTLNAPDGAVTSNMAIVPATSGSVSIFASNASQVILDIFGYFAP